MSVVGFDLGNLNCYIAVARQGGIEVLTNDYSLHATPSCVSFGPKRRAMGVAARQQANMNIKNTVLNFKQLIGRKFSDPVTQKFKPFIPCEVVQLSDDNIGFKVEYMGQTQMFTPEQITAILLVKLKEITQAGLHEVKKVTDCVVSVPFYFTDTQRRCLLGAVQMSGLSCLRIVNENTAVALAYGIYKQDLPAENESPRIVAFVDIGHSASQATLVAYNKGKLSVLGATFDLEVGGLMFDAVIRDHFRKYFIERYKLDAATNARAWLRLLDECEKLKKQMSANSTSIPLHVECMMNDRDCTGQMQRSEFEELAAPYFERIRTLLKNLLTECNKKADQVDEVEIVGGSSRIPAIKKIIAEVFGKEPKTTMNQDEAVARGAAMQNAILSPAFRVREFVIKDAQPYRIKLSWGAVGAVDGGENDVFVEHDEFPFSKMLTLFRQQPFQLTACYAYPNLVPHLSREIGTWIVKNVTAPVGTEQRKVKVKVRVNPNGIFSVTSATTFDVVEAKEEAEAPVKGGAEPMDTGAVNEKAEKNEKDKDKEKADAEKEKEMEASPESAEAKPKTKTISLDLPVEERTPGIMNLDILTKMELDMQDADRREKEKGDAKNAVEEYVYYMRDKLSSSFAPFITDQDLELMQRTLTETEDWLYGDGEDTEKKVYEQKIEDMKKLGDPVQERYKEHEMRRGAYDDFDRTLMRARKAYDEYSKGSERFAHLDSKEMEEVINAVEKKKKWLDEQRAKQDRRPKTEAPVVFVHQIVHEQELFDKIVTPILTKPKPKAKPPPAASGKDTSSKTGDQKATPSAAPDSNTSVNSSATAKDGPTKADACGHSERIPGDDMEVD